VDLTGTPHVHTASDIDTAAADVAAGDLRRLLSAGSNLLVRGEKSATAATVVALRADLSAPLVTWSADSNAGLPQLRHGTVVLEDVDRLNLTTQRALLGWLDSCGGRVRVISTANADLFDRVMNGDFLDLLYYRLNTIVVDVVSAASCCSPQ
jgi:sigma-54-interacting transcriptional regulator